MYEQAKQIIRQFEGLRLKAYFCPAGKLTVGYGHVLMPGEPHTISIEQAETYLDHDVEKAAKALTLVKVPLTDNQKSALIDFIFNLGAGALATSTLLKLINQKEYIRASDQFSRWVYAKKEKLPGLVKRREAERKLFLA